MTDDNIIDTPERKEESNLFELIRWWERRRIWYNLAVLLAGIKPAMMLSDIMGFRMLLIEIILYAIAVNGCYTLGWLPEVLYRALLRKPLGIDRFKRVLFIVGIILSCFATLLIAALILNNKTMLDRNMME